MKKKNRFGMKQTCEKNNEKSVTLNIENLEIDFFKIDKKNICWHTKF